MQSQSCCALVREKLWVRERELTKVVFRFINTPIMTEAVISRLGPALQNKGSEFAEVDDSVKAVLRIACDSEINGEFSSLLTEDMVGS